jgi:DNA recombination protein Rad52
MSFTVKQRRSLAAKLKHRHVKTRLSQGSTISYLEGWHVIAEANRIFGYESWDRQTLYPRCIWSDRQAGQTAALYSTKVRITVRAGGEVIIREGIGAGFGRTPSEEAAHEIALKAAETDATKRALATFGNSFGLALYDRDQAGVTRPPQPPARLVLSPIEGSEVAFETQGAFADAAFAAIQGLPTVDALYAFWERNRKSLVELKSAGRERSRSVVADAIVAALKARVQVLGQNPEQCSFGFQKHATHAEQVGKLAFPKENRLRNKEHLKFVAQQPCLICGRQPAHAHHVRFAQKRALGMKVSDEFTVPLCSVHHDAVHRVGDERRWWARQAIEPLKAASAFWATTRARPQERDDVEKDVFPAPTEVTQDIVRSDAEPTSPEGPA